MKSRGIGLIDCARLELYKTYLDKKGHAVRSISLSNATVADCTVLIFCEDHLAHPAAEHLGSRFQGEKIIIGTRTTSPPGKWQNVRVMAMPLLPIELEKELLASTENNTTTIRILVVEDSKTMAVALKLQLEKYGFGVEVCESFVGVPSALRKRVSLAVLDLNLPGVPGEKIGEMLRKEDIPVVLYSSESTSRLSEAEKNTGAITAFSKRTPPEELAAWVHRYFTRE